MHRHLRNHMTCRCFRFWMRVLHLPTHPLVQTGALIVAGYLGRQHWQGQPPKQWVSSVEVELWGHQLCRSICICATVMGTFSVGSPAKFNNQIASDSYRKRYPGSTTKPFRGTTSLVATRELSALVTRSGGKARRTPTAHRRRCRQRLMETYIQPKKSAADAYQLTLGGDEGIRTLDAGLCPHAPLAGECLRPLGHVS